MSDQFAETTNDTPAAAAAETALAETAKPEDASLYIEERKEQQHAEETGEPVKKASRWQRMKAARDAAQAEAAELRAKYESPPLEAQTSESLRQTSPENPYEDEIEQGRREAEFAEQMAQRDEAIRQQVEIKMRADQIAQHFPDFHETIRDAQLCELQLPPVWNELIAKHPLGPLYAYALAKDAFEGSGILWQLQDSNLTPTEQAREFGRMEEAFKRNMEQSPQQQHQVTKAPAPLRPVSGGSSAPKDLASLARSDDASDYIKARRKHV
jgi:hypothetical protein